MSELLLVRHGEQLSFARKTVTPEVEDGLSELGRQQAQNVAELLRTKVQAPHKLLVSPLRRAQETAQPIARALQIQPETYPDIQEIRIVFEIGGDIEVAHAAHIRAFAEPDRPTTPGSETFAEFYLRVSTFIDRMVDSHKEQRLLMVAHGGVIEAATFHLLGIPRDRMLRTWIYAAHGSVFHFQKFAIQSTHGWKLMAANWR